MSSVNGWLLKACITVLLLLSIESTKIQGRTEPERLNFCDVVASPATYDGKSLSVGVMVTPIFHSLSLYSPSCPSKEGFDVSTEAILPDRWVSQPNGKKLSQILKHGQAAKVQLVGVFRSAVSRRHDGQRFTFRISQIVSVAPR
jgi:hypothetical protein